MPEQEPQPETPTHLAQTRPADPPTPATARRKPPAWWATPQAVSVYALVVALVELVAFGLLGWMWWLIAHACLAVAVLAAARTWRGRGRGGVFGRLLGGHGRALGGGAGFRTGGKGGGRWPGLGGRPRANTPGQGGRMASLRGRLPKALGGTRPGRNTRSRAGGPQPVWKPGRSSGRASGAARSGRRPNTGTGRHEPKRNRPGGELAGGKYNPLNWRSWTPGDIGYKQPGRKPPTDTTPPGGGEKPPPKAAPQPADDNANTVRTPDQTRQPQPARPQPAGTESNGAKNMSTDSGMQYGADQSLQRAGANLAGAEEAAAEVQRLYAQAEAAKAKFTEVFGRATEQMENDLPAAARLKAEMEATKVQAQRAATADEWRAVSAQAATLPATYRREHEVDEERLAGGRGGRHKEKRADVGVAEQDN